MSRGMQIQHTTYTRNPAPPQSVKSTSAMRTMTGSMPKYLPNPAHTPAMTLSVEDLLSFFSMVYNIPQKWPDF